MEDALRKVSLKIIGTIAMIAVAKQLHRIFIAGAIQRSLAKFVLYLYL